MGNVCLQAGPRAPAHDCFKTNTIEIKPQEQQATELDSKGLVQELTSFMCIELNSLANPTLEKNVSLWNTTAEDFL